MHSRSNNNPVKVSDKFLLEVEVNSTRVLLKKIIFFIKLLLSYSFYHSKGCVPVSADSALRFWVILLKIWSLSRELL